MRVAEAFLIVLLSVAIFVAVGCEDEARIELTETRPLLLIDVPPFLEAEPRIDQIAGHTRIFYSPVSSNDPTLRLEEFEVPAAWTNVPVEPSFQLITGSKSADSPRNRVTGWRCGNLYINANIWWEMEPNSSQRDVVSVLQRELARACRAPSSVPTPSVTLRDDRIPPTCEASELDAKFEVIVENFSDLPIRVRAWADDRRVTIGTADLPPSLAPDDDGSQTSGGYEKFLLDLTTSDAGLTITTVGDEEDPAEIRFGKGGFPQDAFVNISGPPLDTGVTFSRCTPG